MSDTKSLRTLASRAACWESEHEPVITFFTEDGDVWGFPFFGLLMSVDLLISLARINGA